MDEDKVLKIKRDENIIVMLVSMEDIGGYGTKEKVLDNIQDQGYLKFNKHDLEVMTTRNELFWRNRLAFVRKYLEMAGFMYNKTRNDWRITPKGISYLHETIAKIIKSKQSKFNRLTNAFYDRINKKP